MCLSYNLSCRTIHPGPMQASLWVSRWFRWLAWSWINDVCSDSQLASNAAQRANPKQNRRTGTMAKILTTVFDSGWTVLKCCQKAPCKLIKQVLKLGYVFEVLGWIQHCTVCTGTVPEICAEFRSKQNRTIFGLLLLLLGLLLGGN